MLYTSKTGSWGEGLPKNDLVCSFDSFGLFETSYLVAVAGILRGDFPKNDLVGSCYYIFGLCVKTCLV